MLTLAEIHIIEGRIKKAEEYLNAAHWSFLKNNDRALAEKKKDKGQILTAEYLFFHKDNNLITKSIYIEHLLNYMN